MTNAPASPVPGGAAASPIAPAERFAAVLCPDGEPHRMLGVVSADPASMLHVEAAAAGNEGTLAEIVQAMNAVRYEHTVARPPEGAAQYAIYSNVVERGSPEFLPALRDHMRQLYGLELR